MKFYCPVCGYHNLGMKPYKSIIYDIKILENVKPPYEMIFDEASYEVCDCCGYEFGNDDNPGTSSPISFEEYRNEWQISGCKWFKEVKRPINWNFNDQMKKYIQFAQQGDAPEPASPAR